jgi:hypothetical protein
MLDQYPSWGIVAILNSWVPTINYHRQMNTMIMVMMLPLTLIGCQEGNRKAQNKNRIYTY